MVMNPNTSVKSVAAIPMHAMTPRIVRNGLIGKCSATSGLGINALLLTQSCHVSASFHSGERTRLACWRWRPRHHELFRTREVCREGAANSTRGACAPQSFLTRRLRTRKLRHEYQKHALVSDHRSCDV